MHILIGVLTVLAAIAFWYYRMRDVGRAAGEMVDAAERARGLWRRKRFLGKVADSPLASIGDARTAAAVLLATLARDGGRTIPLAAEAAIKTGIRDVMGVADPTELYTFAAWASDHARDAESVSGRFSKLWLEQLDAAQRRDLLAMATEVAGADGGPSPDQANALRLLPIRLGLSR